MGAMDLIRGWGGILPPKVTTKSPLNSFGVLKKGKFVVPLPNRINVHNTIYKVLSFHPRGETYRVRLLRCPIRFLSEGHFIGLAIDPAESTEICTMDFAHLTSIDMGPCAGTSLLSIVHCEVEIGNAIVAAPPIIRPQ